MTASDRTNAALAHWLNRRKATWDRLENQLKQPPVADGQALSEAEALLSGYRAVMSDLSLSRRIHGDSLITRYLEALFLALHHHIHRPPQHLLAALADLYHWDVPNLLRQMHHALLSALALFITAIAAGWLLVTANPELAALFASQEMLNHVQSGQLWTDGLLNIVPSSLLSVGIIANNIAVTLFAFALGAFYGIGTVYIVSMNGLILGGIFAFTSHYGLAGRLFAFIVGHGVVELSVIILACAMGLQLGEALIRPGRRSRLEAFQTTSLNAGKVLLAATPFLLVAGTIEGFISPDPHYHLTSRVMVGIGSGVIFWSVMLYGLPWRRRKQTAKWAGG